MSSNYEIIRYKQGLNTRIVIHCVNQFKMHWHKELELLLVLKGEVQLIVNGVRHDLREDDMFLVNSGQIHSTIGHGDNIIVAIQINLDAFDHIYPQLKNIVFEWPSEIIKYQDTFTALRKLIAWMVSEYRRSEQGYQIAIESDLNALMLLILRNIPGSPRSETLRNDKELQRVQSIIEYIELHYTDKISLEQVAKNEFMSSYYLSHFFKAKMGITFQDYLNYVRLNKAIAFMNKSSENISEIALNCGFANVKSFNNAFREAYGTTPGEYRRLSSVQAIDDPEKFAYMEFDSFQALGKLETYMQKEHLQPDKAIKGKSIIQASIDLTRTGSPLHPLKRMAAVGRAYDCLRGDLQDQLRLAKKELGIDYLRFHGIFNDEMRVVTRNNQGIPVYFWSYVDRVLDFLTGLNIHPILDLTFMPSVLSSREITSFWYRGNISKPKKLSEWQELIQQFAAHCLNRYGKDEVRAWYFEIWNEPDYMWVDTQEDYFDFYRTTVYALHSVDRELKIAGPSIMTPSEEKLPWTKNFIRFINQEKLPLDAFTYHVYGESEAYIQNQTMIPRLGDKEFFSECIDHFKDYLKEMDVPVKEIFITEYNISAVHKNYLLDTMFPACHMLYDFLANRHKVDGIVHWTLSDIFEEDQELNGPFHGGFGMITREGIRKPTWYAGWFLSMLGDEILEQSGDYIITRREDDIQILAYSYVFYDELYRAGDRSLLKYDKRYDVFGHREGLRLSFRLENINGLYDKREYLLDREHGSAYDLYEQMGFPAELSSEDVTYLRSMARPQLTHSRIPAKKKLTIEIDLPPHGICMVLLNKQWEG